MSDSIVSDLFFGPRAWVPEELEILTTQFGRIKEQYMLDALEVFWEYTLGGGSILKVVFRSSLPLNLIFSKMDSFEILRSFERRPKLSGTNRPQQEELSLEGYGFVELPGVAAEFMVKKTEWAKITTPAETTPQEQEVDEEEAPAPGPSKLMKLSTEAKREYNRKRMLAHKAKKKNVRQEAARSGNPIRDAKYWRQFQKFERFRRERYERWVWDQRLVDAKMRNDRMRRKVAEMHMEQQQEKLMEELRDIATAQYIDELDRELHQAFNDSEQLQNADDDPIPTGPTNRSSHFPNLDEKVMEEVGQSVNQALDDETTKAVASLEPRVYLNDIAIELLLELLVEKEGPRWNGKIGCQGTKFFLKVKKGDTQSIDRWLNKFDLSTMVIFLVPIHIPLTDDQGRDSGHWVLAVLDFVGKRAQLLDSMVRGKFADVSIITKILEVMKSTPTASSSVGDLDSWQIVQNTAVPQQNNSYDCGLYLVSFARCILALNAITDDQVLTRVALQDAIRRGSFDLD